MSESTHKFELAGLGKAPFRCVGFSRETYQACHGAPIQPGGSCDFCWTPIMDIYHILSADGRRFKVGCECVKKTDDTGLMSAVKRIERKRNAQKRAAKAATVKAELSTILADEGKRQALEGQPCPHGYLSSNMLRWADWMLQRAGAAGRARALKAIKAAL
jgi:hypothetical protein